MFRLLCLSIAEFNSFHANVKIKFSIVSVWIVNKDSFPWAIECAVVQSRLNRDFALKKHLIFFWQPKCAKFRKSHFTSSVIKLSVISCEYLILPLWFCDSGFSTLVSVELGMFQEDVLSLFGSIIDKTIKMGAVMALWWERSPPTNVARVQFPGSIPEFNSGPVSYVGCSEGFSPGSPVFLPSQKLTL